MLLKNQEKSKKIEEKSIENPTLKSQTNEKIEEKSINKSNPPQKIEEKSIQKSDDSKKIEEKSIQKSDDSKKIEDEKKKELTKSGSGYIKKGVNPNSLKNLKKKSKKIEEKSIENPQGKNFTLPKNSNFMLYLGVVIGVIAVTTGVYFAWSYFKNKKSKKIEEKSIDNSIEQSSIPDLSNLSDEDLEKLKKIEESMENFKE